MVRFSRHTTSAADSSSIVPSVWRILVVRDETPFASVVMIILSLVLFIALTIEGWLNDWQTDLIPLFSVGVVSLLGLAVFPCLLVQRVRFIREMFARGVRVQARIRHRWPERYRRPRSWFNAPRMLLHCQYHVRGEEYREDFRVDATTAGELEDAIWLRVNPADPRQAVIEQFYL